MGKQRRVKDQMDFDDFGLIEPQAVDIEASTLSVTISIEGVANKIMPQLSEKLFYKEDHQSIYFAIKRLVDRDDPVDIVSVTNELKTMQALERVGGPYKITQIVNSGGNPSSIDYYIKMLIQKSLQRELINLTHKWKKKAYDDSEDIFELLEEVERDMKTVWKPVNNIRSKDTQDVTDQAMSIVGEGEKIDTFLPIGEPKFDKLIGFVTNKIWTIGGANGDGKTRYLSSKLYKLLEKHTDKVSIMWNVLEDSAVDMLLNWLASKVYVKTKNLQRRNFPNELRNKIKELYKEYRKFDIEFEEVSSDIESVTKQFELFCLKRENRFKVLVIDNILSLSNRKSFRDYNQMYDYICETVQVTKQKTGAMVILVHHFNDQMDAARIKEGFRPIEKDLKGTEAIRRISNYVTLLNNPYRKKPLVKEYNEEKQEMLKRIFIAECVKVRDDNTDNDINLIHYFKTLDYNIFEEIN